MFTELQGFFFFFPSLYLMQAAKYALMTHLVAAVVVRGFFVVVVSSLLCSVLLTCSETLLWLRLRQGWGGGEGGGWERYSRVKKEKDAM